MKLAERSSPTSAWQPAAQAVGESSPSAGSGPADWRQALDGSPRMVAQRARLTALGQSGPSGQGPPPRSPVSARTGSPPGAFRSSLQRFAARPPAVPGPRPVGVVQRATDPTAYRDTAVLPEFRFESLGGGKQTVQQVQEHQDRQMGGVARDDNRNNLVKRRFEDALATFVFHRWDLVGPVVLAVSRLVLGYFQARQQIETAKLIDSMQAIREAPETLGSAGFQPTSPEEGTKILLDEIPTSLSAHLNVHGKFSFVIYSGKDKDFQNGTAAKIMKEMGRPGTERDYFDTLAPPELSTSEERYEKDPERGRPRLDNPRKNEIALAPRMVGLAPDNTRESDRLGIPPEIDNRPTYSTQKHKRGGDLFVLNETKRWTQEARLLYDMPVMAGPSGSAAYMMNTAMVLGLPTPSLSTYAMAMVGSIVGGGHHTFHEIMTVAARVGVPYVPGNYMSAIPAGFRQDGGFQELARRFFEPGRDFAARTRSPDGAPTRERAQDLEFGLPPVADDGDMASMRRVIAMRLGARPEDIVIEAISDGRDTKGVSGSPVFAVRNRGERVGVVKVFQSFGEMGQELSAMTAMNELALPGFVAPRVLGLGKLAKGRSGTLVKERNLGFIFSDIAAGQPLDDLMAEAGKAKEDERAGPMDRLDRAVGAVARQLASLHRRTRAKNVGEAYVELHVEKVMQYALDATRDEAVRRVLDGFNLMSLSESISGEFRKTPGPGAISHGDAHPGNFFHDGERDVVTAIDTPTMDPSIGKERAVGSPSRDVENFLIKLGTVGHAFELSSSEIARLQLTFTTNYGVDEKAPPSPAAQRFFRLRTRLSELRTAVTAKKVGDIERLVALIKSL